MNDPVKTRSAGGVVQRGAGPLDKFFGILALVGLIFLVVLAGMSIAGSALPAFNPALETWTKWVASVLAIIATVKGLWAAAAWLQRRATDG